MLIQNEARRLQHLGSASNRSCRHLLPFARLFFEMLDAALHWSLSHEHRIKIQFGICAALAAHLPQAPPQAMRLHVRLADWIPSGNYR